MDSQIATWWQAAASVRLLGAHAEEWLGELREAMSKVDDQRAKGPEL